MMKQLVLDFTLYSDFGFWAPHLDQPYAPSHATSQLPVSDSGRPPAHCSSWKLLSFVIIKLGQGCQEELASEAQG